MGDSISDSKQSHLSWSTKMALQRTVTAPSDPGDWSFSEPKRAHHWDFSPLRRARTWIGPERHHDLRHVSLRLGRLRNFAAQNWRALRGAQAAPATASEKSTCTAEAEERGEASACTRLMSAFQIPAYMVEDYIMGSYRPLSFSYRECIRSWGYVHSELGNIYTHLLGAIVFACLALVTGPVIIPELAPPSSSVQYTDYIIAYVYLCTVLFCMAASVAFHTLSCHSKHVHFRSLRCDFIGILVLISGSFIPILYYGFYKERALMVGYICMILGLSVVGVGTSILGKVEDPRRQSWRPIIFAGISLTSIIPVVHSVVLNGYREAMRGMSLWYIVTMGCLYLIGTAVYAFKIPERFRPGRHDVFLHSHQIFHAFVVLAAVCHFVGIIRAMMWAHRVAQ